MMRENTVKIDIKGLMSERFINLANESGAVFFDVARKKDCISATVGVSHLRHLRKAARLSKCKVRIYDRRGPKFAAAKARKRFMLALGFVMVSAAVLSFTRHTWLIEVSGNEKMPEARIMEMLESYGISAGMIADADELREIEERILMDEPALSFIALRTKGITMTVKVVESKEAPLIYNENRSGDIVAACDAVVESISALKGTPMVKAGETVREGQVLIAGHENGRTVCALGEVSGSIWYQGSGKSPLFEEIRRKTGRETVFRHFKTPMMYVIITEGEVYAQSLVETYETGLLDGLFLGISVVTEKHYETVSELLPVDYEQAKALALEAAYANLLEKLPLGAQVKEVTVTHSVIAQESCVQARVNVRTVRDIAEAVYYD